MEVFIINWLALSHIPLGGVAGVYFSIITFIGVNMALESIGLLCETVD